MVIENVNIKKANILSVNILFDNSLSEEFSANSYN